MWTRTYLVLLAARFYFAISPSYIHPDENFQGPEVIAGKLLRSSVDLLPYCALCARRVMRVISLARRRRRRWKDFSELTMHKP